jgi:SAM-dependent methyltransferase
MASGGLTPAAAAFDAVAADFHVRFGDWLSVAAQRRAVRAALAAAFPVGARLLEIGGGTGDDALWLADRGRKVLLTDASPTMVRIAAAKLMGSPECAAQLLAVEEMESFAASRMAAVQPQFDGVYSNFAALNCVPDLDQVARGLSRLTAPGAAVLLVMFGTFCPGEIFVEGVRGRPGNMFRRRARGDVPARLGGREFAVRYHRSHDIVRSMAPWFELRRRQGIGLFVPPSAAEPWISRHPRLLAMLERLDHVLAGPLAGLSDHILYHFERRRRRADD